MPIKMWKLRVGRGRRQRRGRVRGNGRIEIARDIGVLVVLNAL